MSTSYLNPGLPAPTWEADGLSRPYWEGLQNDELKVQQCHVCQTWQWGPEWICHKCLSENVDWVPIEGRGLIYSWTRVWHPTHPALKNQGAYLAVLVELPDFGGIRMLGNLLGDPLQVVTIGAPVTAVFEHHSDAEIPHTLLQWELADR